jgi:hypothetical protein
MNTGQMLLATGAMVLLGLTIVTVNRSYSTQGAVLQNTEIGVYAVSLATSIVEEASGHAFDESTVDDAVTSPNSMTAATSLGTETGETTSPSSTLQFDDFDDYNKLTLGFKVAGVDSFTVKCSVYYINPTAPDVMLSTQTFDKRLDVKVFGSMNQDTVKVSYIFSYFNFR